MRSHDAAAVEADLVEEPRQAPPRIRYSFVWKFSESDDQHLDVLGRYLEPIQKYCEDFELIAVSDGSSGDSIGQVVEFLREKKVNSKVLGFHRFVGESSAVSAGFKESAGDIIVVLPSYLQIDPGCVEDVLRAIESENYDYVATWRHPRVDHGIGPNMSRLFNWLTQRITGVKLNDLNSGLRAMRRQIVDDVPVYGELFRFLPVLAAMQGFRLGEVRARHLEERVRRGDYSLGIYARRILDILTLFFLTKFTRKPLRFFGLVGSGTLLLGVGICGTLSLQKIFWSGALAGRPLLILGTLLIALGIQLFSIGLLGELIIFIHARDIHDYKVERVFDSKTPTIDG